MDFRIKYNFVLVKPKPSSIVRCKKCRRILRTVESIRAGFGKKCRAKLAKSLRSIPLF